MFREKNIKQISLFFVVLGFTIGVVLFLLVLILSGIPNKQTIPVPSQQLSNGITPVSSLSRERLNAWRTAVNELIQSSNKVVNTPSASYRFNACFLKEYECIAHSQAYRDEFKRITFYFAPSNHTYAVNHASFYLSLGDFKMPRTIMRLTYVGERWIYFNKVSILINDELIFETNIDTDDVLKEAISGSQVYEVADVLMINHLNIIEKIATADAVAIRFQGRDGEAYLSENTLNNMQRQAREILVMYQLMADTVRPILDWSKLPEESFLDNEAFDSVE